MQAQILTKPAFSVIGFSNLRDCSPGVIPGLWEKNGPTLMGLPSAEAGVFYGVMNHFNPEDRSFEYLAAISVAADAPTPDGMVRWDIPEQTYAVFDTTLATTMETFHALYQIWFPSSGYQRGDGAEFEHYDERFDTDPSKPLTLWIPVVPRQEG